MGDAITSFGKDVGGIVDQIRLGQVSMRRHVRCQVLALVQRIAEEEEADEIG